MWCIGPRGSGIGLAVGSAVAGAAIMMIAAPQAFADDASELVTQAQNDLTTAAGLITQAYKIASDAPPSSTSPDINDLPALQAQQGFQSGEVNFVDSLPGQITGTDETNPALIDSLTYLDSTLGGLIANDHQLVDQAEANQSAGLTQFLLEGIVNQDQINVGNTDVTAVLGVLNFNPFDLFGGI